MKKIRSLREEGEIALLDPKHTRVLRIQIGENVKILLSDGRFALGKIIDLEEPKAHIYEIIPPIEPKYQIYLVLSILKKQKSEQAVEFSSQIGIRKIIPVITERVEIDPTLEKKIKIRERFIKIAIENAKVSGTKPPEINEIVDMRKVPEVLNKDGVKLRLVFWENSDQKFVPDIINKQEKKTAIFVGPEGGFSEKEIYFLRGHGFSDFNVGERIIKAEFFPMYICSVLDFILNIQK